MPIIIIPSGKNTIIVPTPTSNDDDVQLTPGECLFILSASICIAIFVAWLVHWGTRG